MTPTGMSFHAVQHQGKRDYQEDSWAALPPVDEEDGTLLIVCDGMGGHSGGNLASKLAAKQFARAFEANSTANPQLRLQEALNSAHELIVDTAQTDESCREMGTTLCAIYILHDHLYWISVGDSPFYRIRNGEALRLNDDHSMAPVLDQMAASGELTKENALNDSRRNALRSVVGAEPIRLIDCQRKLDFLQPRDVLIVASDGIQTLSPDILGRIADRHQGKGAIQIADALLEQTLKQDNPRQDNVTLITYIHQPDHRGSWRDGFKQILGLLTLGSQ